MTDDLFIRDLLFSVERRGCVMHWCPRDGALYVDRLDELPAGLVEAMRDNVGALASLVRRIGCRVGFRYVRTCWHLAVNRIGYLESACGVVLLDEPAPVAALPNYSPHEKLCARCVRHMVARELARLPRLSPQERRV